MHRNLQREKVFISICTDMYTGIVLSIVNDFATINLKSKIHEFLSYGNTTQQSRIYLTPFNPETNINFSPLESKKVDISNFNLIVTVTCIISYAGEMLHEVRAPEIINLAVVNFLGKVSRKVHPALAGVQFNRNVKCS